MTNLCLDDDCYNLTKQLAKKLEFLSHAQNYVEDDNKKNNQSTAKIWQTIISDDEKHAELLRNQLAQQLQKLQIPS